MKALVVRNQELRLIHDAPVPVAADEEVLIRTRLSGICNTDLELIHGYYDFGGILGHEFVGDVVQGPSAWIGRRVVAEINVACGECEFCVAKMPSHCRTRSAVGIHGWQGAFAEYLTMPIRNLYEVPGPISDRQAVFVEPLAAALQVTEMVHVRPSARTVVLGAGKLGMLIAQVLHLTGSDLAVVVRHDRQSELLKLWGIPAVRFEELPKENADVVVDVTGQEHGFADALELVRARGTIVLKSTYHGLPQADLTRLAVQEVTVVGSRCGPFDAALRLLAAGHIDVESMVEQTLPLTKGVQAFEMAQKRGALKVLLSTTE